MYMEADPTLEPPRVEGAGGGGGGGGNHALDSRAGPAVMSASNERVGWGGGGGGGLTLRSFSVNALCRDIGV
jgi:hypothetical protein